MKRRPYLALFLLTLLVIGNGLLLRHYLAAPNAADQDTIVISTPPFDKAFEQERKLSLAERALVEQLNLALHAPDHLWPNFFQDSSGHQFDVKYTIDEPLQAQVQKLLKQYRSDFGAVVVLDNNTGGIKVALDHDWSENRFGKKLAFFSTSPAASLFKVITAADVLERGLSSSEYFTYRGKPSTLFKTQLGNLEPSNSNEGKRAAAQWEKSLTFKTAFAKSNNVVFGKAALQYTKASHIYQTAERFGFNQLMIPYLDLSKSYFPMASDAYNLAELASGLNTTTLISPLHAAFIAMTIVNNGELKSLTLIDGIYPTGSSNKNVVEEFPVLRPAANHQHWPVIKEQTAETLREMMQETLLTGTAMKIRKQLPKALWERWEIGAKTGQMTGGIPLGKRDWIMLYAKPKDGDGTDLGISMAIMLVNQEKWYVRSTAIAKEIIQYYDGTKTLKPQILGIH